MSLQPFAGGLDVELGVWPAYVGIDYDPDHRAQIQWRQHDDQIIGSARIAVPAGTYSTLYYFHRPRSQAATGGSVVLDEPITLLEDGVIDIDPITG